MEHFIGPYHCFLKWANPGLFFVYFHLFKQTLQFSQQINVKKCPSSIQSWDSNSQPYDYESPHLTVKSHPSVGCQHARASQSKSESESRAFPAKGTKKSF